MKKPETMNDILEKLFEIRIYTTLDLEKEISLCIPTKGAQIPEIFFFKFSLVIFYRILYHFFSIQNSLTSFFFLRNNPRKVG